MFALLLSIAVCFTTTSEMEDQSLLQTNRALRSALKALSENEQEVGYPGYSGCTGCPTYTSSGGGKKKLKGTDLHHFIACVKEAEDAYNTLTSNKSILGQNFEEMIKTLGYESLEEASDHAMHMCVDKRFSDQGLIGEVMRQYKSSPAHWRVWVNNGGR